MRKLVFMLVVTLFTTLIATAQSRVISGTVKDDKGEIVPFASVLLKGTKTGVAADAAGDFKINAKTGDVLVISAVGYTPIEISVGSASVMGPILKKNTDVSEVVVTTTLGREAKTKTLGYQVATVKSAELTQAKAINLQNGLTGKISGVNVLTTNNSVFADTRITLRGIRSLTGNNQPMLILDGTPIALSYINSINPNDIADVNVLKSSTSTAIYGPDGVNGAIVINTKKGAKGKPSISFSNTTQFESISYLPKFQTEFGSGYDKDVNGNGTYTAYEQQSWGDRFDGSIRQIGEDGPGGIKLMVPYAYNKNGRRNFFQTGITNQTDVSYSAGDFYLSAQNVKITGVLKGDENNRRTVTMKSEKEYGKFKAGFNLRYTNGAYNVTTNNRLVYYGVTSAPGQIDLGMFEDWRNDYFSSPDGYYTTYIENAGKTPYFAKDNYREIGRTDDILANLQLDFKATSWLKFTYRIGTQLGMNEYRRTRGAFTHSAFNATRSSPSTTNLTASIYDVNTSSSRITGEFFAQFSKKVSKFEFDATIGHSYRESKSKTLFLGSNNLGTSELLAVVARKGEPDVSVGNAKTKLERYFGSAKIGYDGWVYVEATASYDRDSRLASPTGNFENKSIAFFYPGVSGSVILSEVIPAIKNSRVINFLKLRGGISKTGNVNLGAYGLETEFSNGLFFPYGSTSGYLTGTTAVQQSYQPEYVLNKEVGFEIGFLKKKITLEATYYNQTNTDQIIGVQISNTSGYTSARQNAASFVNEGLEFDLNLTPLVKINKVNIDLKLNYTYQTSQVKSLIGGVDVLNVGNFNYAIVNNPAYVFQLTDYIRDPQGRVVVDKSTGMPTANPNLTKFGRTQPTDIFGLNLNVSWKDLTFSAVVEYRGGNQIVSDDLGGFMDDNGISERSGQSGRRAFIFPNSVIETSPGKFDPNTNVYTKTYGREFWNSSLNTDVETNYLSSGAFWKIREIAINYNIPKKVYKWNAIKGMSIGISGRNLFMFLPKSNQWTDPEFSSTGSTATIGNPGAASTGNAQGRNTANNLPPTRIFGASLSVQF